MGGNEWFRVHVNQPRRALSQGRSLRDWSFIRQVLEGNEAIVVPDVQQHPVFAQTEFPPAGTLRGYAGVPLFATSGRVAGAMCLFDLAWTHSQVTLRQINATESDARVYGRLAGSIVYANASLRAETSVLLRNRRGQSALWSYAISGDLPIVLLQIAESANIELVRQLVQAHAYWRLKGLPVDLVIWNDDYGGYRQVLQDQIMGDPAMGWRERYRAEGTEERPVA